VNLVVVDCRTDRATRRRRSIALVVALTLALAGCGGNDSPSPTPTATRSSDLTATAAAASTPTPQPPPEVGEIVWTISVNPQTKAPEEVVDGFAVDDLTLYAVLPVRNLPTNASLTAEWTYNDTSLDNLTSTAVVPSGPNAGWVEFHLTRSKEPWPDGTYAISVTLDGKVVQSAEVTVNGR
jgi:hypothetical protein